jgi:hypothetical protein
MRTPFGMLVRMTEITVLAQMRTKVAASPMAKAVLSELLVASVGHKPSNSTKIGFERTTPLVSSWNCTMFSTSLYPAGVF